ncbi:PilZ domain-containing protein [Salicola sp. Rm-C-2C1-2]|uniref:PilZ domain-containing protein n=1 Tax=Salicola sp. Rm-C-2C1-2 TaxID=3141321 RepID=UPI0032E52C30
MRDNSDKRDFIRMNVDTAIELIEDEQGQRMEGRCVDLSATGMAVEMEKELAEGQCLHTSLPSHNPDFPPFETVATVLRSEPLDDGRWRVGLRIDEVKR